MFANIRYPDIEQLSHCLLCSPYRLILDDNLHLTLIIGQLVQYKLYLLVHILIMSLFHPILHLTSSISVHLKYH